MILNREGMFWLFISAYTPLFLVLIIKISNLTILEDTDGLTAITILLLFYISIGSLLFVNDFLKRAQRLDAHWTNVKIEQSKNEDYAIFIVTYLVPFFGIEIDFSTLIALFVLFSIIGYIYVNNSLFRVNPVLNIIWKYNLYQGTIGGQIVTILSKEKCRTTDKRLKLIKIADNIYLNKREVDLDGPSKHRGIFEKFNTIKSKLSKHNRIQ